MKSWKWKRLLILIPALLLNISVMGIGSCEELANCLCAPTTGNAQIDAFFSAAADLRNASARVEGKINTALDGLAGALGLSPGSSAAQVSTALCSAFSDAGISFNVSYQEPKCTANAEIAAKATAECDVSVDPGEASITCEGKCEGTCRASCTGECRMPSVSAYCSGECHGSCWVDVSASCNGTCHGSCSGSCSVMEGGQCAGACDGTCTGKCEAAVAGGCSGECHGECTVTADPGGCNGRCEGTCNGSCEGKCEGTVRPPSASAQCDAQVEAKAEASVECEPPQLDFGVDTSGVDNIAKISAQLGEVLAASAEAGRLLDYLGTFAGTMNDAASALISGQLSIDQAACAIPNLNSAVSSLGDAQAALTTALSVSTELLTCP
jgi:hypothetical protein